MILPFKTAFSLKLIYASNLNFRLLCLEQKKTLYVPVPSLQNGFLNRIELPEGETGPSAFRKAVSRHGMEIYGKPLGKSILSK